MARSSYIYLALDPIDYSVCGAWTVKHEMVSDINGHENRYVFFRVNDGHLNGPMTRIDLTDEKT